MNDGPESSTTLLVATVGGAEEPLVKSIQHWRPTRILFAHSPETIQTIPKIVQRLRDDHGFDLDPGRYDYHLVEQPERLSDCMNALGLLESRVHDWLRRGSGFSVVADFTGGTKCMSAALVFQARRWSCRLSYVGGFQRHKDGVGIVVSGAERVVQSYHPSDDLGLLAWDDFATLFNEHHYGAAADLADRTRKRSNVVPSRKRWFAALHALARAYHEWDAFRHQDASKTLADLPGFENDLNTLLDRDSATRLLHRVDQHRRFLNDLLDSAPVSRALILDLVANAQRCGEQGRHDDATARLYRAIEAIAQLRLQNAHQIDTSAVPRESIPERLRTRLALRADDGALKLGLQDAYALLEALDDDLGRRFRELALSDPEKSPLSARNQSILAHGFMPVGAKVANRLRKAALELLNARESDLPDFPKLRQTLS